MKRNVLLTAALIPLLAVAGTGPAPGKPQKAITTVSPSVNYLTIQNGVLPAAQGYFKPMPFATRQSPANLQQFEVHRDPKNGMPILIDGMPFTDKVSAENQVQATQKVIGSIADALGIQRNADAFRIMHTETDRLGTTHIKLQQVFNGVDIYGAQAWLHFANGKVCFNGRTQIAPNLPTVTPVITEQSALAITRSDVSTVSRFMEITTAQSSLLHVKQFESHLVVLPDANRFGNFNLAWHVTVYPNLLSRWEYFVDATTGAILNKYENICSLGATTAQAADINGVTRTIGTFNANGTHYLVDASKSMYTGTQNALPATGKGIILTLNAQNTSQQNMQYADFTSTNNNTWNDSRGVSAHYNAAVSWDYYKNTHGRNSINGNGGDVISFANVADDNGGGLDNAFWTGQYMIYGNGNTQFKPLAGDLDVGGHEMTHGVIQETAGLEYQGESGAMNESFADVFGSLIERNSWRLGEGVVQLSAFPSGCLRDLSNPHNGGNQLGDAGWQPAHTNEQYTGTQDNGGVHINSGITNNAYYRIANTLGKGPAELIYYRALSLYLTKSSKFIDCRLAVVKAAEDLHGVGSNESNVAKAAFDAVGIFDGTPTNTNPTLPNNPGGNKLLLLNLDNTDQNTIYLTDDNAQNFTPISQTPVTHKPSVTDDGSYAVFVGTDNNIYSIQLTSPFTQNQLTTDNYWSNVAISKDGTHIAATSQYQDTAIWVYDFGLNQWGKFKLYNPTTGQGEIAGGVLYADALEWDYTGEYIMYDAYNKINGTGGQFLDYWDIGFDRVWNRSSGNFGDGQIFKAYSSLPEGVSVGNPTFSKNSPNIIAFDFIDSRSGTADYYVVGANLEIGASGTIFHGNVAGFPTFNPQDNKVAFNNINTNNVASIAFINVDQTKINGNTASAVIAVLGAGYAQWFGTGTRQLPSAVNDVVQSNLQLYPNPANNRLSVVLPDNFNQGVAEVYNLLGEKVISVPVEGAGKKLCTLDVSVLNSGAYLLRLKTENSSSTARFEKF